MVRRSSVVICPRCRAECDKDSSDVYLGWKDGKDNHVVFRCHSCNELSDSEGWALVEGWVDIDVSHTCANCQFNKQSHCHVIMVKLGVSGYRGNIDDDFSCSLWEKWKRVPFRVCQLGPDNYEVRYKDEDMALGRYDYSRAALICDWLNSLWNEEKGDKNESS